MSSDNKNTGCCKKEIAEIGKLLYEKGLSPGTSGNISIKIDNKILISPSGLCLGDLCESDIVTIDMDGNTLEGKHKPSSEKTMHMEIYNARNDISAIIHAHPPKATAFAVAGVALDMPILSEAYVMLGKVPVAEYATPSSKKLADIISNSFLENDAVMLANHGVVVGGKKLKETFYKLESLELYAEVTLYSKILGNHNTFSSEDIKDLDRIKAAYSA